jgi:hypothetical protein
MNLEQKFIEIIERKHSELNLGKDYSKKFSKIKDFEGNAVGQIGEEFVKLIISKITSIIDDGIIHNEFDVKTNSGILFEVKTARKGRTNNTFQFNGINPAYNYDYLLCLGICEDQLLYRIFLKSEIKYIHNQNNNFFIIQNDFEKQLVKMNPNNLVNFKLTLNINELNDISNINKDLIKLISN